MNNDTIITSDGSGNFINILSGLGSTINDADRKFYRIVKKVPYKDEKLAAEDD